jgi:hypothetical protein
MHLSIAEASKLAEGLRHHSADIQYNQEPGTLR